MTVSTAEPAAILREICNGTGAGFAEAATVSPAQARLGPESLRLLNGAETPADAQGYKPWGVAIGVIGLAGAAFLAAIAALAVAFHGAGKPNAPVDPALAEIPRLEASVEALAARVNRPPAPAEPIAPLFEKIAAMETRLQDSVAAVTRRLDVALAAVKAEDDALALRLGKVESHQAEEDAALQALQLRTTPIDPTPTASARPMSALRLKSVRAGVAVVEGPQGRASVSVGDALFEFGKVLKIGKHGRKGVIVTEQGQLSATLPRAAAKAKPAAL